MREPDVRDVVSLARLRGDSIAYAVDSVTAGVYFPDHLSVVYTKAKPPAEYKLFFSEGQPAMSSQIVLINDKPVEVQANGLYFNPLDLMSNGYWAWAEKIANMLPFDYELPAD